MGRFEPGEETMSRNKQRLLAGASVIAICFALQAQAEAIAGPFEDLCGTTITTDVKLVGGGEAFVTECVISVADGASLEINDYDVFNSGGGIHIFGTGDAVLTIRKDSRIRALSHIDIEFAEGNVKVEDSTLGMTSASGSIDISTTSGNLKVQGNTIGSDFGELTFKSYSGNVKVKDNTFVSDNKSLEVSSHSGDVKMEDNGGTIEEKLEIFTTTGNIWIGNNDVAMTTIADISVSSATGNIRAFDNDFRDASGGSLSTGGNCKAFDNTPTLTCV